MGLYENKDTDNFYPRVVEGTDWHCNYLWSTHRGCPFDCVYCSSKRLNKRFGGDPCEIRRLKGEWIKYHLFGDCSVFMNPYCDIFALVEDDVRQILEVCNYSAEWDSRFIFQTKDPLKYFDYLELIPEGSWLGTTIESTYGNQEYEDMNFSKAPAPMFRSDAMFVLRQEYEDKFKLFITIEPIMEFNYRMLNWMNSIQPDLIFIGADTGKNNLPEPSNDELIELIYALYDTIGVDKVYLKSNIRRLIPAFYDGWKLAEEQNKASKSCCR